MKTRELNNLGIPKGAALHAAVEAVRQAAEQGLGRAELRERIAAIVADPTAAVDDPLWGSLAQSLQKVSTARERYVGRQQPAPWRQWGDDLEAGAVAQMADACKLPVTVAGALMPDAHLGYGLPIGGVLATQECVIPYAVGVDIACRMKMSVLDLPVHTLETDQERLRNAIERETQFGIGASFKRRRQHDVMDADWSVSPITWQNKDKAWKQLGTSGSGNHFVEFGVLTLPVDDLGLSAGTYLALLSHSGSRGTGAAVCAHYSSCKQLHPDCPASCTIWPG